MVSITLLTFGSKHLILAYVRKVFAEYCFYYLAYLGSQNMILAYVRKVLAEYCFYYLAYFGIQKYDLCLCT